MHILVTGAAGMIGRKLVGALGEAGSVGGRAVDRLTLVDVTAPAPPDALGRGVKALQADLSDPEAARRIIVDKPDLIFHLAAIVSGEAEADFAKGYKVNLEGTWSLFEAIREEHDRSGYCPRVVFTSSLAVYGAPLPDLIDDTHLLAPRTSYGAQKAICELLLDDYSRKGYLDGVGIRLPTICIRPGKPNKAASGFFSSILREPLAGQPAVLPVEETVQHWFASPRAAVGYLLHGAALDTARLGSRRSLNMPGVLATVAEQIEALRRVAGDAAVDLIGRAPDPAVAAIIKDWPRGFDPARARALGFRGDACFDDIIRIHIRDEMGGAA